ncbi:MAG: roadblock/LC7 domain-containing protein [Verrucomicrobia bacterium]|nr:roadblock/LC7 domain-containing protein [Verrucomicrobiota bacterium]
MPLSEVEKALRRGKAAFSWRQLRAWIQPPLPPSREPTALEVAIELPLGIVAPEFLARRKPALAPQRNCEVAESIPNLFGLPAARPSNPASAVLDQAVLRTEQPAREVQTQSAGEPDVDSSPLAMATDLGAANANGRCPPPPAPAALPSPGLELGRIFDQPGKRSWTVSEIVRNTAQIQGVAGALLVTLDGLLIAAELPPGLAAETVAAFVPQMFSRVTQYATELGLGEPRHLTFSIEDTPLLIFKSGCVYFAVLGRARENLPGLQLRTIAAALPRPDRSS